jgi:hypothetical protein
MEHTVAYLLKARTVEPEKRPFLGNGCVTHNSGVTVGSGVLCASRTEAIDEDQLPLWASPDMAVRRVRGWCRCQPARM